MDSLRCPITDGLSFLQFGQEHGDDDLAHLAHLKQKFCHVMAGSCSAAAFFVASLNSGLRIGQTLASSPHATKVTKRDDVPFWSKQGGGRLRIGVIGCGRLARQLLSAIVAYSSVEPSDLLIGTPRPETVEDLLQLGMSYFDDNSQLVQHANIVFLSCLPCRVQDVAHDIRGHINPSTIVYSLVAGIPLARLQSLTKHTRIVVLPQGETGTSYDLINRSFSSVVSKQTTATPNSLQVASLALTSASHVTATSAASIGYALDSVTPSPVVPDTDHSMHVTSETCLVVSRVDTSIPQSNNLPEHLLSMLRSPSTCHAIYPLARILDKDPVSVHYVRAEDGVMWLVTLALSIWDCLHAQFHCPPSRAIQVINAVLFNQDSITAVKGWWKHTLLGVELSDFQTLLTGRDHAPNGVDSHSPVSFADSKTRFAQLHSRLSKHTGLAKAMEQKFTTVMGIPEFLHGKSAMQISQTVIHGTGS